MVTVSDQKLTGESVAWRTRTYPSLGESTRTEMLDDTNQSRWLEETVMGQMVTSIQPKSYLELW